MTTILTGKTYNVAQALGEVRFGMGGIEVELNWSQSIRPQMTCAVAEVNVGSMAAPLLGFGQPHVTHNSTVVAYDYKMNADGTLLSVTGRSGNSVQYILYKIQNE